MKKVLIVVATLLSTVAQAGKGKLVLSADICIYGGTSAGVMAAYTAAMHHKTVVLIEPGHRLGGLSSGGLGFTDIGNKYVVSGLARDFYRRIGQHYGKFEQWIFEPGVAESIFLGYIKRSGVKVLYGKRLNRVEKSGTFIRSINLENTDGSDGITQLTAQQFIDCSYEGDLMAQSGVSYTTGRESNSRYHETVNGVQLKEKHQFPDGVDPYTVPGKPETGLLWGISKSALQEPGWGDTKIQAYNFRLCLTNVPENRLPIERPDNYDAAKYELLLRYMAVKPITSLGQILKMDKMPNGKTDINNQGPFSTDMIGMNYGYPEGNYATRDSIFNNHLNYTKGLLYFIGHDPRMPATIRKQMLQWGYPKDEYTASGHFTPQLYVREARRMTGAYIMTQANCERKEVVVDGVGMAAYTMDSHNAQRIVVNGMVKNEGDVQLKGVQPYPVAYRAITPRPEECTNLLVPVCLSASHIAYGSIRMEPVFMVLAQSAATAAVMAIDNRTTVQAVDIPSLQRQLEKDPLADGSTAEILVDDAEATIVKGNWAKETTGGYGPSLLVNKGGPAAAARFVPVIAKGGRYGLYFYYPRLQQASAQLSVEVFDGDTKIIKTLKGKDIQVTGQTSGEWVHLGEYELPAGRNAWVELTNSGANGAIAADAVLLVPVRQTKNE